jgi:hypothetical protein
MFLQERGIHEESFSLKYDRHRHRGIPSASSCAERNLADFDFTINHICHNGFVSASWGLSREPVYSFHTRFLIRLLCRE